MKEELREVVYDGKKIPGYYVSNFGNVYTNIKYKRNSLGQYQGIYFSESKTLLKPSLNKSLNGTHQCLTINLRIPNDLYEYEYLSVSKTSKKIRLRVHRLVMEAFRPMMEFPPERLKPFWDQIPHEVKLWICESPIINHIDHDSTNNRLDNLEYVTPRENSRKATEFYGGNVANKGKIKTNKKEENKISILDFV